MPQRLLEVVVPTDRAERAGAILDEAEVPALSRDDLSNDLTLIRAVVAAHRSEAVMDRLEEEMGSSEGFRILVLRLEASVPRIEEEEPAEDKARKNVAGKTRRISREELLADVTSSVAPSIYYPILVALSSVVAAVGILKDSPAVIIGAMVIAPLLGPNVALALGTTLGELELVRKAALAGALGVGVAFVLGYAWAAVDPVETLTAEMAARTCVDAGDFVLALAAGGAGVLSITMGAGAALVGVMVAVALLPPIVTSGLLAGSGIWPAAVNAFLLGIANVICVNLAGVVTFLAQGVRPVTWWEADRARRATTMAILSWTVGLILLLVVVRFARTECI